MSQCQPLVNLYATCYSFNCCDSPSTLSLLPTDDEIKLKYQLSYDIVSVKSINLRYFCL